MRAFVGFLYSDISARMMSADSLTNFHFYALDSTHLSPSHTVYDSYVSNERKRLS